MEGESRQRYERQARLLGAWSLGLAILGLGFIAIPVPPVAAIILAAICIRTARRAGASTPWTAVGALILALVETAVFSTTVWLVASGNIRIH